MKIIGNPVPSIDLGQAPSGRSILSVGRLIKTKNMNRLVEIFTKTQNSFPEWQLYIVGGNAAGGHVFEELKKQVEALEAQENVFLEGERKNVYDYLRRSEIFAFTSTSEGFPNALAEAMSAGLAVIAYDCMAGPSDLIDDGVNGFLIPEGDEDLFNAKLMELMASEAVRKSFGAAAKEKMKNFQDEKIASTFFKFITE